MSSEYIDETFIPRPNDGPINNTDKVAMRHDLRYSEAEAMKETGEMEIRKRYYLINMKLIEQCYMN